MQVERNKGHHSYKCWLTTDEFEQLHRAADSYRDELVIRLGGEVGLRRFEVPQIRPEHVSRHVADGEDYFFLRVPRGKDTAGEGGKPRDAYLPRDLERDLHRYVKAEGIADDEPIIDVSGRTVRRITKRTAEQLAEETGDDDWRKVSSHDLRRYFAHRCLVEQGMNPRVVMDIGGWSDFQAIEPYLSKPTPDTVVEEFDAAGMV